MSLIEHFKDQPPHQHDGIACWYVMSDKNGTLEVHHVVTTEVDKFLEGTTFVHMAGMIPRFDKPREKGKWKNPLKNDDDNSPKA